MPVAIENSGSTTRDFQMLERNLLSHVKLAILLSLLSSSILLRVRLPGSSSSSLGDPMKIEVPIASIEFVAALCAIFAGVYQYFQTYRDFRSMRGFLVATKFVVLIFICSSISVHPTCLQDSFLHHGCSGRSCVYNVCRTACRRVTSSTP